MDPATLSQLVQVLQQGQGQGHGDVPSVLVTVGATAGIVVFYLEAWLRRNLKTLIPCGGVCPHVHGTQGVGNVPPA